MKKSIEAMMEREASIRYEEVAYDLPKKGNYHYHSTIAYLGDWLYDKFNKEYPEANFGMIAKRVARQYMSSDTEESKRNEARREARHKRNIARIVSNITKESNKEQKLKHRAWDQKPPVNKGVGSY